MTNPAERQEDKTRVEKDARGQFAPSKGDRKATGVASAKPTVLTPHHSEDATIHRGVVKDGKTRLAEWDPQF